MLSMAHAQLWKVWGAVVDKSIKHSINVCKNFEINYILMKNKEKNWNEIICTVKKQTLETF